MISVRSGPTNIAYLEGFAIEANIQGSQREGISDDEIDVFLFVIINVLTYVLASIPCLD